MFVLWRINDSFLFPFQLPTGLLHDQRLVARRLLRRTPLCYLVVVTSVARDLLGSYTGLPYCNVLQGAREKRQAR